MAYAQRDTPVIETLCVHLVEHHCGELAARVFSVLARYGRQTLSSVARASYLNTRQSRMGMSLLVQEDLVFHSSTDPQATYYEINWVNTYGLVRHGPATQLVQARFGKRAAKVLTTIVSMGQASMEELREVYFPTPDEDSEDEGDSGHVNGTHKTNGVTVNGTSATTNGVVNGHATGHMNGVVQNGLTGNAKVNGVNKRRRAEDDTGDEERDHVTEDENKPNSVEELDAIVHHLMLHGWIMQSEENQHLSPGELHVMARNMAIETELSGIAPTGITQETRIDIATLQRKRDIRDAWTRTPEVRTRKRKAADPDFSRSSKRLKAIDGHQRPAARDTDIVVLHAALTVRLNPEKVAVAMRTEELVRLVDQRLGHVPAVIYQIMLRMIEEHLPRCYEPWPDPLPANPEATLDVEMDPRVLVAASDVLKKIDKTVDLLDGLDPSTILSTLRAGTHRVTKENKIHPPIDPAELRDAKPSLITKHIELIANHPFHFVTWHSRAGGSQWRIEFEEIAKAMVQHEIETTISAGPDLESKYGVKLIRALHKKGKLDERGIGNAMMMQTSEIRSVINGLTLRGFIQTQEIPRVERREAKHSLHLIYYDRQRAREKLLHDTYKGMTRIVQRLMFEKERVQTLLEKAERTDVEGNESMYLSQDELDTLKGFKGVEEKLMEQLFRQDELVATLRDYIGPLMSA
ncbi:DNA directed RNA polymeras-like protein III subunit Rpc82 [Lophiostoma macrostomum CBS 122681]|uniref:DNA-directed RNA polymerase III subunit RPC3 n=1 Tax=Lophiostoma macrostomum CBS 122681 TaxID=1314788 RepID=A0A6A6SZ48_9PLEO|nr:DNA directed RNA polymeras-like protein III subunit Rpc82 [Lophiostoma macrostomum CBS 122681]